MNSIKKMFFFIATISFLTTSQAFAEEKAATGSTTLTSEAKTQAALAFIQMLGQSKEVQGAAGLTTETCPLTSITTSDCTSFKDIKVPVIGHIDGCSAMWSCSEMCGIAGDFCKKCGTSTSGDCAQCSYQSACSACCRDLTNTCCK